MTQQPPHIEPTRLIGGREAAPHDEDVLAVVRGLPPPRLLGKVWFSGIADEAGHIYRRVVLFGPVELLEFAARMNAAGFSMHPAWRGVTKTYKTVFYKASCAAT
jgi:hypothetical protein